MVDLMFNGKYPIILIFQTMRTGRPKLPSDDKKAKITGVRLNGEERAMLEKAALMSGRSLSSWMREVALAKALQQTRVVS
jgi:hypothetical protein